MGYHVDGDDAGDDDVVVVDDDDDDDDDDDHSVGVKMGCYCSRTLNLVSV